MKQKPGGFLYRIRLIIALTCFLMQLNTAYAVQEITPGMLYHGGTQLGVTELGIEFAVPKGWKALLPEGSELLIMEPDAGTARMIISAAAGSDESTVLGLMSQARALDLNNRLVPAGSPKKRGALYHQSYDVEGANPQNLVADAWARVGSNQTAFFTILLEPESQGRHRDTARRLVESVSFGKTGRPQNSGQQTNTGDVDWEQRLKGRALRYLKTKSGYSVDKRINLCSDHSFIYSDNDNYMSNDAISSFSASSQSGNHGRWEINGNRITLTWADGSVSQYDLSRRYVEDWNEWGTFVDNERWFEVANNACD